MSRMDLLLEYLRRFRVECHYRLDMTAADFEELPFYIYEGAHKEARRRMMVDYNLEEEFSDTFDEIYSFFEKTIVEEDNYNVADDMTVEAIKDEKF